MNKPTESEFLHHVQKEFAFLQKQWGLKEIDSTRKQELFNIVLQNKNVFVSIRGVDFGAGTEIRIGQPPYKDRDSGWPLWLIIDVRDPSRHPKSMWEIGGQFKQASKGAKDLKDLCQDLLSGNFTDKNKFDRALKEWRQCQLDGWREFEQELEHQRAISDANEAFRNRDYESVVSRLQGVTNLLTPAELKKLEYARKKIKSYRDREKPHSSPLPHRAAYGSGLRGSADQASSAPGERKSK